MKLSMWHIAESLAPYDPSVDIRTNDAQIAGVRFVVAGTNESINPNTVYLFVVEDEDAPEGEETVFLANKNDIISVVGVDANQVLNRVLATFDLYNQWEDDLRALAARGAVQELIDRGYDVLKNPMVLADDSGNVLAMTSKHRDLDLNSNWVEMRETGRVPVSVVGSPRYSESGEPARWTSRPGIFLMPDGTKTIGANLVENGMRAGAIALWETETPIARSDLASMQVLCDLLLATRVLVSGTSHQRTALTVLSELVEGEEVDDSLLRRIDLGFEPPYGLVVVRSASQDAKSYGRNLIARMEALHVPCAAFVSHGGVCALAPWGQTWELVEKAIGGQAQGVFCSVISLPFDDLADLKAQFSLADFALGRHEGQAGVLRAEDSALPYLLGRLRGAMPSCRRLVHPALGTLARYDAKHDGDLYRTLGVFLRNDRSHVLSAEELHMHRNSFSYRIRRIVELTGIDLDDADEREYLRLSYLLEAG